MEPFHIIASPRRSGLTLIEMLVAATASLILFGSVMAIFSLLGTAVNDSRALTELEGQLCMLATQVSRDLVNATATRGVNGLAVLPPSGSADGYFEIVEGPMGDLYDGALNSRANGYGKDSVVGDVDDALLFTCRTNGDPYRGRFGSLVIGEPEAEIAYFCGDPVNIDPSAPGYNPTIPATYTLYRRQVILSRSAINNSDFVEQQGEAALWSEFGDWNSFYSRYDLSVRYQPAIAGVSPAYVVLNTMNDLQKRNARLGHHDHTNHLVDIDLPLLDAGPGYQDRLMTASHVADSVIAKGVLAFDVKILDQQGRRVISNEGLPLVPSDKDYWNYDASVRGGIEDVYVDLHYNRFGARLGGDLASSTFSGASTCLSGGSGVGRDTFDTWSTEHAPDPPPYNVDGLAGIQVTIRLIDTRSKQIIQRTITHGF